MVLIIYCFISDLACGEMNQMMNFFLQFRNKDLTTAYQKEVDIQNGTVFRMIRWFVVTIVIIEYVFKIYQRVRDGQASHLPLDFILAIAVIGGYLFALLIKRKTQRLDRFIDAIYLILYCYGSFYITYDLFKSSEMSSQYEFVIMGLQSVWIQYFFFTVMKNWMYKVLLVIANILILSLRTINTGEAITVSVYFRGAISAIYTVFLLYINEKIKKVVFIETLLSRNNSMTFENIIKHIPETIVMLNLDLTIAHKNNYLNKFFQPADYAARRSQTTMQSMKTSTNSKKESIRVEELKNSQRIATTIAESLAESKTPTYEGKNFVMKLTAIHKAKLRDRDRHFRFLQMLFPHEVNESMLIHAGDDGLRPENAVIRDFNLYEILEAISKDIYGFKKFLDESPDGDFLEMDMKYTPDSNSMEERSVELKISIANFSNISSKLPASEKIVLILRDTTQRDIIARLEDNNHYKDALLASVSHELRTPLNTNINSLESILMDVQVPQPTKLRSVIPAIRNAKLLLHIINDILDLSQITSNRIKLTFESLSLKETIISCLDLVMYQAERKNLSIDWQIDPRVPDIICTDHARLSQVILNLLKNAVKFTFTDQGVIKLRVEPADDDAVLVSIEDPGIGLNEENKEKLRNMFSKMDTNERIAVRSTGAGLGLNVSNILAKMLGPGDRAGLMVESEVDKGSTFKFLIEEKPKGTVSLRNANGISTLNLIMGDEIIKQKGKEQFCVPGMKEINMLRNHRNAPEQNGSRQALDAGQEQNDSASHIGHDAEIEIHLLDSARFGKYTMSDKMTQSLLKFSEINHPMALHRQKALALKKLATFKDKPKESADHQFVHQTTMEPECRCPEILVVDDEPFNVMTLEQLLGKWNKSCLTAFNGQEALKKIKNNEGCSCEPNDDKCRWLQVIMMDKNMPIMDGIETTKEIRRMTERGEIRRKFVIGNTAYVGEKELDEFKKSGVDEILLKPIDKVKVGGLLAKYLPEKTTPGSK